MTDAEGLTATAGLALMIALVLWIFWPPGEDEE